MVRVKILDQDERFFISKMVIYTNEAFRCKAHLISYGKGADNKITTQFYGLSAKEFSVIKNTMEDINYDR